MTCPECGKGPVRLVDAVELRALADATGQELLPLRLSLFGCWWCRRCQSGGALLPLPPIDTARAPDRPQTRQRRGRTAARARRRRDDSSRPTR